MRRRTMPFGPLLLVVMLGAVGVSAAPASAVVAAGVMWKPCAEAPDDPTVDCATVRVPVDWSRPRGPSIELALARRIATDPEARIGTLLFDLGGPGSSGVDSMLDGGPGFSDEIRRRFDIVGVDPRGIGRSHPVICSLDLVQRIPLVDPTSQASLDRMKAHNKLLRADCRARTGPLFDHVDTLSVVRDLDAIRGALREPQITFYGTSYGTVLAGQYAEQFPQRVRAMVLDSILDHNLTTRGLLDAGAVALQDSYDGLANWCDAEPTCALHSRIRAVTAELFARTERGEIIIPGDPPRPATPFDLADAFQRNLRIQVPTTILWPALAQSLLDLYNETPTGSATDTTSPSVAFPGRAVRCQDFQMPLRDQAELARLLRRSANLAPDLRFAPDRLAQLMFCLGTPTPIANPQHPLRVRTAVPLLLVNNRHDPVTGYTMATNVAKQLGHYGRLLTSEDWGHGTYNESGCTVATIDRYLINRVLPAPGTTCPAAPADAATRRSFTIPPLLGAGPQATLGDQPGPSSPRGLNVSGPGAPSAAPRRTGCGRSG